MQYKNTILILATLTTALVAGVFYTFAVAINPAFKSLDDVSYIQAMQAINKAIVNPLFAFSFFGSPIFLIWATIVNLPARYSLRFRLLLLGCVIYLIGGLGVTVFANIPLNEELSSFAISSNAKIQTTMFRNEFMTAWNKWHTVWTTTSVIALFLLIKANFAHQAQK